MNSPTAPLYITTRAPGTSPIEGWRATVVVSNTVTNAHCARCNCGWVDPHHYNNRDAPARRAQRHIRLHEEGLTGPGDAWPSLQDPSYLDQQRRLAAEYSRNH